MVRLKQYVFLQRSRLDLVILNQHVFSDGFNGVFLARGGKRCEVDSAESSLAQLELNVKVDKIYIRQVRLFAHRRRPSHILLHSIGLLRCCVRALASSVKIKRGLSATTLIGNRQSPNALTPLKYRLIEHFIHFSFLVRRLTLVYLGRAIDFFIAHTRFRRG